MSRSRSPSPMAASSRVKAQALADIPYNGMIRSGQRQVQVTRIEIRDTKRGARCFAPEAGPGFIACPEQIKAQYAQFLAPRGGGGSSAAAQQKSAASQARLEQNIMMLNGQEVAIDFSFPDGVPRGRIRGPSGKFGRLTRLSDADKQQISQQFQSQTGRGLFELDPNRPRRGGKSGSKDRQQMTVGGVTYNVTRYQTKRRDGSFGEGVRCSYAKPHPLAGTPVKCALLGLGSERSGSRSASPFRGQAASAASFQGQGQSAAMGSPVRRPGGAMAPPRRVIGGDLGEASAAAPGAFGYAARGYAARRSPQRSSYGRY